MFTFYFGGKIKKEDFKDIKIKNYIGVNGITSIRGGFYKENLNIDEIEEYVASNELDSIVLVFNSSKRYSDIEILKIKTLIMNYNKIIDSIILSTDYLLKELSVFCRFYNVKIELGMTYFMKNYDKNDDINIYLENTFNICQYVVLPPEFSAIETLSKIERRFRENIILMALDDCLFACPDRYRHQVLGSSGCTIKDDVRENGCSFKKFMNEDYYKKLKELGYDKIKVSSRTSFKKYEFWIDRINEVIKYVN